jgi:hypothetical protein
VVIELRLSELFRAESRSYTVKFQILFESIYRSFYGLGPRIVYSIWLDDEFLFSKNMTKQIGSPNTLTCCEVYY